MTSKISQLRTGTKVLIVLGSISFVTYLILLISTFDFSAPIPLWVELPLWVEQLSGLSTILWMSGFFYEFYYQSKEREQDKPRELDETVEYSY